MQAEMDACKVTLEHIDERLESDVCDEDNPVVMHPSCIYTISDVSSLRSQNLQHMRAVR